MWRAALTRRVPLAGRPRALRLDFKPRPGMRVGLYGGSFNPAHEGHAHVARTALKRLDLDCVVWLVSPQNPLKPANAPSTAERARGARRFARIRAMIVSDAEQKIGSRYTIDTVRALKARFPGVRFVWIMGADSLAGFHRWRGWTQILGEIPVAVVARPGETLKSRFSPTARRFAGARVAADAATTLADRPPPAWVYLTAPLSHTSSTAVRTEVENRIYHEGHKGHQGTQRK